MSYYQLFYNVGWVTGWAFIGFNCVALYYFIKGKI